MATDAHYLARAFALAETRRGFCAPNPAVGAVIVHRDRIVAEGAHRQAGLPHAEVEAVRALPADFPPEALRECTLYITLEPCNHFGRTPPCTALILEKNFGRVVFAYLDPNPIIAGRGQGQLVGAGVRCDHVALPEGELFYRSYAHWTHTRRPWITAKLATSLDGKSALAPRRPLALTGEPFREWTHRHRRRADALLSTARTIEADDPQLNVRLGDLPISKPVHVTDRHGAITDAFRIARTADPLILWRAPDTIDRPAPAGARRQSIPVAAGGLDLPHLLTAIGDGGVHDLWVEAGGHFLSALLDQRLVHTLYWAIAPTWVGERGLSAFEATPALTDVRSVRWETVGRDAVAELEW